MPYKILIAAGGTGGHLYPAQGFAQQLLDQFPQVEVLFAAGGLSSNRYFDRTVFPFQELACAPLSLRRPFRGITQLCKGVSQGCRLIKSFQPDVVVGFGSYYTVSTLLAAKLCQVPIILHEANSIPGKANKVFAPFVEAIGVHFPQTISLLKGRALEVGLPLRKGYRRGAIPKEEACHYFGLSANRPVWLVFGGSQGAQSINQMMRKLALEDPSYMRSMQIVHLTGKQEKVEELEALYRDQKIQVCVKPFEDQMQYAWSAASFFLGRAGASTIAEAMEFEVPALLIPYPHAAENHQEQNADFFAQKVGGGIKITEKELTLDCFKEALSLFVSESFLRQKREAIQSYKRLPERDDLCGLVIRTADVAKSKGKK